MRSIRVGSLLPHVTDELVGAVVCGVERRRQCRSVSRLPARSTSPGQGRDVLQGPRAPVSNSRMRELNHALSGGAVGASGALAIIGP